MLLCLRQHCLSPPFDNNTLRMRWVREEIDTVKSDESPSLSHDRLGHAEVARSRTSARIWNVDALTFLVVGSYVYPKSGPKKVVGVSFCTLMNAAICIRIWKNKCKRTRNKETAHQCQQISVELAKWHWRIFRPALRPMTGPPEGAPRGRHCLEGSDVLSS